MPVFTIEDPETGRTVQIEGDSPPTEAELADIFRTMTRSAAPEEIRPQIASGIRGDAGGIPDLSDLPLRDGARQLLQGGLLGFGDEVTAATAAGMAKIGSLFGGPDVDFVDAFRDIRDTERSANKQFEATNPKTALALNLIGGLATGTAAGGAAQGLASGGSLVQRLGTASGLGAAAGGVTGVGESEAEGISGLLEDGAKGATLGAVLGPAAEGVGGGALRLLDALKPESAAARKVVGSLAEDGLNLDDARAAIAASPGSSLADISEGALNELDSIVNLPGKTSGAVKKALVERSEGQADEIVGALGGARAHEALDTIRQAQDELASPLYERAFARGVEHNENLERIFKTPDVQSAWRSVQRRAQRKAAAEGKDVDLDLLRQQSTDDEVTPSLEGWQLLKESLDDQVGVALRKGRNKEASELIGLKRRLLSELDEQNPDFEEARGIWAGAEHFKSTMEIGKKFLNQSSDDVQEFLKDAKPIDVEAYRVGMAQAIKDKLGRGGLTHDATNTFNKVNTREKLEAVLGETETEEFLATVDRLARQQQTLGTLANSRTARRQARERENVGGDALSVALDFATGTPASTLGTGVARDVARRLAGGRQSVRDQAGAVLSETDPDAIRALLAQIERTRAGRGSTATLPIAAGAAGGLLAF